LSLFSRSFVKSARYARICALYAVVSLSLREPRVFPVPYVAISELRIAETFARLEFIFAISARRAPLPNILRDWIFPAESYILS